MMATARNFNVPPSPRLTASHVTAVGTAIRPARQVAGVAQMAERDLSRIAEGMRGYTAEVVLSPSWPEAQWMVLAGQGIVVAIWDAKRVAHEVWGAGDSIAELLRSVNPLYAFDPPRPNSFDVRGDVADFVCACLVKDVVRGPGAASRGPLHTKNLVIPTLITSRPRTLGYHAALAQEMARIDEVMFLRCMERWQEAMDAVEAGISMARSAAPIVADSNHVEHAPDWTLEQALQSASLSQIAAYGAAARTHLDVAQRRRDGFVRAYEKARMI